MNRTSSFHPPIMYISVKSPCVYFKKASIKKPLVKIAAAEIPVQLINGFGHDVARIRNALPSRGSSLF